MVFAGLSFAQLWLVRERGFDAAGIARQIGGLQIVFGVLGSVVGGVLSDRLARRLPEWQLVTATMFVACVAYALFPLVKGVPLIAAIAFLLGLGLGASQPSLMSLIQHSTPQGRLGEALGIRTTVLNMSHTLLPLFFGGIGTALGMGPVFWSMAAVLGTAGLFARRR